MICGLGAGAGVAGGAAAVAARLSSEQEARDRPSSEKARPQTVDVCPQRVEWQRQSSSSCQPARERADQACLAGGAGGLGGAVVPWG